MFERERFLTAASVSASIGSPTRTDPAVVMVRDRTSVVCWVELVGEARHWFFVSTNGPVRIGPPYRGEHSLDQIRDLVSEWYSVGKRKAHALR